MMTSGGIQLRHVLAVTAVTACGSGCFSQRASVVPSVSPSAAAPAISAPVPLDAGVVSEESRVTWAKPLVTSRGSFSRSEHWEVVLSDPNAHGAFAVAGTFGNSAALGDLELKGSADGRGDALFIASLGADWVPRWARVVSTGWGDAHAQSLFIDSDGAVLFSGAYTNEFRIGGSPPLRKVSYVSEAVLARLDAPQGKIRWARSFPGPFETHNGPTVRDADGSIYTLTPNVRGDTTRYRAGQQWLYAVHDLFLRKHSVEGSLVWKKSIAVGSRPTVGGLVPHGSGLLVSYRRMRIAKADTDGPIEERLDKYTAMGQLLWRAAVPAGKLAVDGRGNIWVAANQSYDSEPPTVPLSCSRPGGSTTQASGPVVSGAMCLGKLDPEGVVLWTKHICCGKVSDMAVSQDGAVTIVGESRGQLVFGPQTTTDRKSEASPFVARILSDGTLDWSKALVASTSASTKVKVQAVRGTPDGGAVIAGSYAGSPTLEHHTLPGGGLFLAKITP